MADFNDKRIRRLVEGGGLIADASVEDLGLMIAVLRRLHKQALDRAMAMPLMDDVVLDPIAAKASKVEDGEG